MFSIMVIKISPRNEVAPKVQEMLTKNGCIIKTRLGLHEATNDSCSKSGLILLELLNDKKEDIDILSKDLSSLKGVSVKLLEI